MQILARGYSEAETIWRPQVFDTAGEQTVELSQLIGHDAPVWQVTWAHPKFGSLLASCSLDQKVIVWKEAQEAQWVQVSTSCLHNPVRHVVGPMQCTRSKQI